MGVPVQDRTSHFFYGKNKLIVFLPIHTMKIIWKFID